MGLETVPALFTDIESLLRGIEFARPGLLWLAAGLPLFWWRWRAGSRAVVLLRSTTLLLLVVGLAEPRRVAETYEESEPPGRVFAFDLSTSITPDARRWMLERAREIAAAPGRDRYFVFAGRVHEVADFEEWLERREGDPAVQPAETDLAALLTALAEEISEPKTLYLFTDGWETRGSVRDALPLLSRSRIRILPMVPSGTQSAANVQVTKVLAPHEAESREGVRVRAVLQNMNRGPVKGRLVWTQDGRPWRSDALVLEPGYHLRSHETVLPEKGLVAFEAAFVPDNAEQDVFDADNEAAAWISVKPKEGILIVNGGANRGRYLEAILRRQGYKVTGVEPGTAPPAPSGFDAVIFNDVPRRQVSDGYMEALRRYVTRGGSFIMVGGNDGFASGGYRGTPLERILPVEPDEPEKKRQKTRGIVLVIDKSGSMRTDRKLAYAKEAARVLAQNLKNRDLLGVVGFDVSPFEVVPLQSMAQHGNQVPTQVARLKAGGKTYLYPALLLAKRMLERSPANLRHVIVLSDGETGGSGSDYIDLVSVMKQDLDISVSAVAIGDEANIPLLKRLSLYGGGAFHHTYDPSTLPRIVASEVKDEPEPQTPEQKEFRPHLAGGTAIFEEFPERTLAPVTGFARTKTRTGAVTDVVVQLADGSRKPLVASWGVGAGKVAALTIDQHGGWSRLWIRWRGLDPFWSHLLKWAAPRKEGPPAHEVRIDGARGATVMDLYVYGSEASGVFRYTVKNGARDRSGRLDQEAPGHYRAALPIDEPGVYRIEVVESRGGKNISYPPIGYTKRRDAGAEIPSSEANFELLEMLARATGGEVNALPASKGPVQTLVRVTTPLYMVPILAAALLFLFEVFVRRWLVR